ncbi:hypothetical protein ABZ816_36150 [Actinosynnema sp. NPDC047251]|uniref:hypothetical protein n=1 Tax=Saccharothrix espanaensis TaxID=103731 RepID=UPI0018D47C0D|nr:hypothetical protein [Saccharothrix espanaensis]
MPDGDRGVQPSLREKLEGSKTAATRGPGRTNYRVVLRSVRAVPADGRRDRRRPAADVELRPGVPARHLFHEDASPAEGVGRLIEQHLRSLERRPGAEESKAVAPAILSDGLLPDDYRIEGIDPGGLTARTCARRQTRAA